ncbi:hypothetical protein MMC07_005842 [Pseudocyphellaria aurata]|nr:hypothetical protein [Pseudocyphellaria aurata]
MVTDLRSWTMHPHNAADNLLNSTMLNWDHGLASKSDLAASSEFIHHALICVFLVESAAVYFSASLLLRALQRDDEIYQNLCVRAIRFAAITIIDACAILIHEIDLDLDTQTKYPLRLDSLTLMCLNFLLFIYVP